MVENLLEIECAYNILNMKSENNEEKVDVLDRHYKNLRCDIMVSFVFCCVKVNQQILLKSILQ